MMYNKNYYSEQFIKAAIALNSKNISDKCKYAAVTNFNNSIKDLSWTEQLNKKYELMYDTNTIDLDYIHYNCEDCYLFNYTELGPFGSYGLCDMFDNLNELFFSADGYNGNVDMIKKYNIISDINMVFRSTDNGHFVHNMCNSIHNMIDDKHSDEYRKHLKSIITAKYTEFTFGREIILNNIDIAVDMIDYIYQDYELIEYYFNELLSVAGLTDYTWPDDKHTFMIKKFHKAVAYNLFLDKYNEYFNKKATA